MSGFSAASFPALSASPFHRRALRNAPGPDRRLRTVVQRALAIGLTAVLLLPAARGYSPWLGWVPLWLVGMPLAALWALHGFRLPRPARRESTAIRRRRPGTGQARRRGRVAARKALPKAA